MKIKYRTILLGEKADEYNQYPNNRNRYKEDAVDDRRIIKPITDYCCDKMKRLLERISPIISSNISPGETGLYFTGAIYGIEGMIDYCPFCGRKIEVVETEKVKLIRSKISTPRYEYEEKSVQLGIST
jgi:hypothetical protein